MAKLDIRIGDGEVELLRQAADAASMTLSAWVREVAGKAAKDLLLSEDLPLFRIDSPTFRLDAPEPPQVKSSEPSSKIARWFMDHLDQEVAVWPEGMGGWINVTVENATADYCELSGIPDGGTPWCIPYSKMLRFRSTPPHR